MTFPDTILFYVDDVPRSQAFYSQLFGTEPVYSSPDFALYVGGPGVKFALWRLGDAKPAASVMGGGGEINITAKSREEVDSLYGKWSKNGVSLLTKPEDTQSVGYTFVATDPDGHRIRVFHDPQAL